ncbi:MAG: MmcQ/YjbR family DNA-binding protein [Candidatus Cloacimonadota bacterium]|nr:MAG: MmcQ/YjbR family DNA-binding protein [Spirochaetota bacterium]RLC50662.1 MAG: MmcQ/YjbR family DNA-binding protein [Candidatus Cloacimonadota bacterium]
MNLAQLRNYFTTKAGSFEDFPFDETTMVIKIQNKMFALIALEKDPLEISLKCDPYLAESFRTQYKAVSAGYHLNKRHWNSIVLDGSIPNKVVLEMIDHSYQLVFDKLTKKNKAEIEKLIEE